jgi:hypothetical protein
MKKAIAFTLVFLAANCSNALTVGLHLASKHSNYQTARNDNNHGVYIANEKFAAGVYKNSEFKNSAYVIALIPTIIPKTHLSVGLVTGYSTMPIVPMVAVTTTIPLTSATVLRLTAVPKPPQNGGAAVVHLSIESKF